MNRDAVIEDVKQNPSSTAPEIAARLGAGRVDTLLALTEAEEEGVIRRGAPRHCRVADMPISTWHIAP